MAYARAVVDEKSEKIAAVKKFSEEFTLIHQDKIRDALGACAQAFTLKNELYNNSLIKDKLDKLFKMTTVYPEGYEQRFKMAAHLNRVDGWIRKDRDLQTIQIGSLLKITPDLFKFSLSGWNQVDFLLLHLHFLFNLYLRLITGVNLENKHPCNEVVFLDQLFNEIWITANAYLFCFTYQLIWHELSEIDSSDSLKEEILRLFIKSFLISLNNNWEDMQHGDELILPIGAKDHAMYLAIVKYKPLAGNENLLYTRIDNVGAGAKKWHIPHDETHFAPHPVTTISNNEISTNKPFEDYLVSLCMMKFKSISEELTLDTIYNRKNRFRLPEVKIEIPYPPLAAQTTNHCVANNYLVGTNYRFYQLDDRGNEEAFKYLIQEATLFSMKGWDGVGADPFLGIIQTRRANERQKKSSPQDVLQKLKHKLCSGYKEQPGISLFNIKEEKAAKEFKIMDLPLLELIDANTPGEEQSQTEAEMVATTLSTIRSDSSIPYTNIFTLKTSERMKEEKEPTKQLNRVLIEGPAGSGKSVLCLKLLYEWAIGKIWIDRFDFVIFIPLQALSDKLFKNDTPAVDLLTPKSLLSSSWEILSPLYSRNAAGYLINENDKEALCSYLSTHLDRVLFVLDGFDQIASRNFKLADYLLKFLPSYLILSRPWHERLQDNPEYKIDRRIKIRGFSPENKRFYIKEYFTIAGIENPTEKADALIQQIEHHSNLTMLSSLPINLRLICYLWFRNNAIDPAITMSDLYQKIFVDWFINTEVHRVSAEEIARNYPANKIHMLYAPAYKALANLAYQNLLKSSLAGEISGEECLAVIDISLKGNSAVSIQGENEKIFDDILRTGIIVSKGEKSNKYEDNYVPVHQTFFEYLAAGRLAEGFRKSATPELRVNALSVLIKHQFDPHYEVVWWFVAGRLAFDKPSFLYYLCCMLNLSHEAKGSYLVIQLIRVLEESGISKPPILPSYQHIIDKSLSIIASWWISELDQPIGSEYLAAKTVTSYLQFSPNVCNTPQLQAVIKGLIDYFFEAQADQEGKVESSYRKERDYLVCHETFLAIPTVMDHITKYVRNNGVRRIISMLSQLDRPLFTWQMENRIDVFSFFVPADIESEFEVYFKKIFEEYLAMRKSGKIKSVATNGDVNFEDLFKIPDFLSLFFYLNKLPLKVCLVYIHKITDLLVQNSSDVLYSKCLIALLTFKGEGLSNTPILVYELWKKLKNISPFCNTLISHALGFELELSVAAELLNALLLLYQQKDFGETPPKFQPIWHTDARIFETYLKIVIAFPNLYLNTLNLVPYLSDNDFRLLLNLFATYYDENKPIAQKCVQFLTAVIDACTKIQKTLFLKYLWNDYKQQKPYAVLAFPGFPIFEFGNTDYLTEWLGVVFGDNSLLEDKIAALKYITNQCQKTELSEAAIVILLRVISHLQQFPDLKQLAMEANESIYKVITLNDKYSSLCRFSDKDVESKEAQNALPLVITPEYIESRVVKDTEYSEDLYKKLLRRVNYSGRATKRFLAYFLKKLLQIDPVSAIPIYNNYKDILSPVLIDEQWDQVCAVMKTILYKYQMESFFNFIAGIIKNFPDSQLFKRMNNTDQIKEWITLNPIIFFSSHLPKTLIMHAYSAVVKSVFIDNFFIFYQETPNVMRYLHALIIKFANTPEFNDVMKILLELNSEFFKKHGDCITSNFHQDLLDKLVSDYPSLDFKPLLPLIKHNILVSLEGKGLQYWNWLQLFVSLQKKLSLDKVVSLINDNFNLEEFASLVKLVVKEQANHHLILPFEIGLDLFISHPTDQALARAMAYSIVLSKNHIVIKKCEDESGMYLISVFSQDGATKQTISGDLLLIILNNLSNILPRSHVDDLCVLRKFLYERILPVDAGPVPQTMSANFLLPLSLSLLTQGPQQQEEVKSSIASYNNFEHTLFFASPNKPPNTSSMKPSVPNGP